MKNRFLLLSLLSFGLFIACDKEEDSPEANKENNEELVGVWYIDASIYEGEEIPYDDHETCGKDYVEFNEDGSYRQVDIWDCEESIDAEATYTANEDTITITFSEDDRVSMDIVTLNAEILVVQGMEDIDDNGQEEVVQQRFTRE